MARMYTPRQLSAVKCLDEAVNSRRNRGDDTPWTSGHTMEVWMYDRELGQLSVKELREARRMIRHGQRKQRREATRLRKEYETKIALQKGI